MQTKERYYDRRSNERRSDRSADSAFEISLSDQNRRHSARRCNPRRRNQRRNLSFEISIPDQLGKTINVSEGGVYFKVITNDMNVYSPGTTIPLKITAVNATPGFDGGGTVVRNCIIENPGHDDSLCVALELTENLILY
jgi:hypothetical protein